MGSLRNIVRRAALVSALTLATSAGAVLVPSDASASVSIAIAFDDLVKDADVVAIITPMDAQSLWEDGRIYTYTRVHVEQGVAGDLGAGGEGWVRTMGGVVGKIGQLVDGEPVLNTGKQSLLFLRKLKADTVFEVSARAQGQYPLLTDPTTKAKKLIRSNNAGIILQPKNRDGAVQAIQSQLEPQSTNQATNASNASVRTPIRLAGDVIHDRALDDASREIASTWRRLHSPPPTK
jgi:hypothetical protein